MKKIKERIEELNSDLRNEIESAKEYADQNLEISRGADFDLMVEEAYNHYENSLVNLCCKAIDRGFPEKDIIDVFGEDIYFSVI